MRSPLSLRALTTLPALPVLLLVLAGCGTETEDPAAGGTDATTSAAPASDLPACEEVWVDGEELPRDYEGCFDGTAEVPADARACSVGQSLVTYADEFYAVPGNTVNHVSEGLEGSAAYESALTSCTG